jgi:hypothetical protein
MLLAEIATDATKQTPLWLTFITAAAGTAASLGVGWFLLTRTEAYRRSSRWEPRAERLWDQRIKLYPTIIDPFGKLSNEIRQSGSTPLVAGKCVHIADANAASVPLLIIASPGVSGAIGDVMETLIKYCNSGVQDLGTFNAEIQERTFALLNAMRDDLHLAHLDKHTHATFS